MIRDKPQRDTGDGVPSSADEEPPAHPGVPALSMLKEHTQRQLEALHEADSVTVDPHKSGYCTYPAGGLV